MVDSDRQIYSVSALNQLTREILEDHFPLIWVEGEISNLARPSSGHIYFTLKDSNAQVRCAMFRMKSRLLAFNPENGNQVLMKAKVGFYEARGEFQLIAEHMEPSGDGLLRQRFEQLKIKLASQGLFDADHKQAISEFPRRLGVITSPSGAAIRDILSVLRRRYPSLPIIIYPVAVQGAGATAEITQAIKTAQQRAECDVLIIARGGGSLEDLWAFNEESVAKAIYQCSIPIVTGIGHEIDFTIADFVADLRAPTPSVAAEMISPDQASWQAALTHFHQRLTAAVRRPLMQHKKQLDWLIQRLQHPAQRVQNASQLVDEYERRLIHNLRSHLRVLNARLASQQALLWKFDPTQQIALCRERLGALQKNLVVYYQHNLNARKQQFHSLCRSLDAISPLATLHRGFAIVKSLPDETIVRRASQLKVGNEISNQFVDGNVISHVTSVKLADNP